MKKICTFVCLLFVINSYVLAVEDVNVPAPPDTNIAPPDDNPIDDVNSQNSHKIITQPQASKDQTKDKITDTTKDETIDNTDDTVTSNTTTATTAKKEPSKQVQQTVKTDNKISNQYEIKKFAPKTNQSPQNIPKQNAQSPQNKKVDDEVQAIQNLPIVPGVLPAKKEEFPFYDINMNVKYCHERNGEKYIPLENRNLIGFTPWIKAGNFFVDFDGYHGNQFYLNKHLQRNNIDKYIGPSKICRFNKDKDKRGSPIFEEYKRIKKYVEKKNAKESFYRTTTRLGYKNPSGHGPNVLIGDITPGIVGFLNCNAGLGFQVKSGWETTSVGSVAPIVITKPSKVECYIEGILVNSMNLQPGVYVIDDLQPELRMHGAVLKIKDCTDTSIEYKVDCYGGKKPIKGGTNAYDFAIYSPLYFDPKDPREIKYEDYVAFTGFYKHGIKDGLTFEIGGQGYKNGGLLDIAFSYSTPIGDISNRIATSYDSTAENKFGGGVELAYNSLHSENDAYLSVIYSYRGTGFTDLGKAAHHGGRFNNFLAMNNCRNMSDNYKAGTTISTSFSHFLSALISLGTLANQRIALVFVGRWAKTQNVRNFGLSISGKFLQEKVSYVLSGGIIYDGPYGGINGTYPDYRAAIGLSVQLGDQVSISGDYSYYEDSLNKSAYRVTYTPKFLKGLEIEPEYISSDDGNCHDFSYTIKYNGDYFNLKLAHNTCDHDKKLHADYTNKFYIGTNIGMNGLSKLKPSSIMTVRKM